MSDNYSASIEEVTPSDDCFLNRSVANLYKEMDKPPDCAPVQFGGRTVSNNNKQLLSPIMLLSKPKQITPLPSLIMSLERANSKAVSPIPHNEPLIPSPIVVLRATSPPVIPVKGRKVINMCAHVDKQYYCKGMCKNCYHSKGREKLAFKCEHRDRKLYARGFCKACYLREHHTAKNRPTVKKIRQTIKK